MINQFIKKKMPNVFRDILVYSHISKMQNLRFLKVFTVGFKGKKQFKAFLWLAQLDAVSSTETLWQSVCKGSKALGEEF